MALARFAGVPVPFQQSHFHDCENWEAELVARGITAGCKIFTHEMAQTASTVSLSILVTIEMLNAYNRYVRVRHRVRRSHDRV